MKSLRKDQFDKKYIFDKKYLFNNLSRKWKEIEIIFEEVLAPEQSGLKTDNLRLVTIIICENVKCRNKYIQIYREKKLRSFTSGN